MARGVLLTLEEKGAITAFHEEGKSATWIGRKFGRTKRAINAFLKRHQENQPPKKMGRPKAIDERTHRQILRTISNKTISLMNVKATLNIAASKTTIYNYVHKYPFIKNRKMLKKPLLTKKHKEARLRWAENHQTWEDQWLHVLFSDEKRFNLDGPNGWDNYWHDLRKEPLWVSKRQYGGGSVMVWAAFGFNGFTDIIFVDGNLDSSKYQNLLGIHLLPNGPIIGGDKWIFQQDLAKCHDSRATKMWFKENNVTVLDWVSRSPDLNPMENVWGALVRSVYSENRQFNNISELKQVISKAWYELDMELLQKLILGMKKRVGDLLKKNGGYINR